jgi:hypothetical protein
VHLYLHRLPGPLPRWLDEGIAQLLDGGDRRDWLERFRTAGGLAAEVGLARRERALDRNDPEAWAGLYLHSFLFLEHLVERHGVFRLDLMVRRLARGKGVEATFAEVYGESPAELDRRWRLDLRTAAADALKPTGDGDR